MFTERRGRPHPAAGPSHRLGERPDSPEARDSEETVKMRRWTACVVLLVATAALAAPGRKMKLTAYDDGLACPGGCDAHVVLHGRDNGTANAHLPSDAPGTFTRCRTGQPCRICFDADGTSCVDVMYRGGGPGPGSFDLTTTFYESRCAGAASPGPELRQACAERERGAARLRPRLSCIDHPDEAPCVGLMAQARAAQERDRSGYVRCLEVGEAAYNSGRPGEEQRSLACAYEKVGTGANSHGGTWKRLLPGVCRDGSLVGRDGTDCCTGAPDHDGALGRWECAIYYVAR